MKNLFLMTALAAMVSTAAMAGTQINCKSANYSISITRSEKSAPFANYGINGWQNDAADVVIEQSYFSERVIAASLEVDGQKNKFELSVIKAGPNKFAGKIFSGKSTQNAVCESSYVVTSDERDDELGQNL